MTSLTPHILAKLTVWVFLEVLKPNTWLIFHTDMAEVLLYAILCQSGLLTQSALRRYDRWGGRCFLPGYHASQVFGQESITFHLVQTWVGNTFVNTLCHDYLWYLKLRYRLVNLKITYYAKICFSAKLYDTYPAFFTNIADGDSEETASWCQVNQ